MKTKRHSFLARAAMTLLLAVLTTATAWADSWPEYITDVVLAGGTESEATSVKNSSTYSGYTWCSTSLNDGTSGDVIYIGYKKGSRANVNGDYITDFIIIDAGTGTEGHNPPCSLTFQERTYYRCPAAGGNYFVNSNHGNLTSQAANGWNMYLYYTKNSFDDKRAVDGISIYSVGDINEHKSGAINCYYKDGTLHEKEISLNKGVSKTPYVYMHINTVTKTNRPSTDPVMASGLVYNGSAKQLIATGATLASGTMYYRVGTSGSFTSSVADVKATAAGSYTVYYYAGSNSYSNASSTHSATVSIAKSPNNGVTVSCADVVEGNAPAPQLVGNLSTGAVTYYYSTTQNGTYTTTVPTDFGKHYVKATIAADDNCYEYTTAPVSFCILVDANDLWNVRGGANGTVGHPFIISTPAGLDLLAQRVNSGTGDDYAASGYNGKYFELGANITYSYTGLGAEESNYTAIGDNSNNIFKGTFDGKGHTVSGIRIYSDNNYQGLFGNIYNAEVKNIILDDATINGRDYIGGIVGWNQHGTVENCHALSTVTVSGDYYVGGIVGLNYDNVRGCTSAATVSGTIEVGGIVGNNIDATIRDCLVLGGTVSGDRIGAILGYKDAGTLTNNYHTLYGMGGMTGYDRDGARFAIATGTKPDTFGDATATYGTGTYTGIKAYGSNGLEYGGKYYWHDENLMVFEDHGTENANYNSDLIVANNGMTRNVILNGRTLYKDGKWNTIVLPFDVDMTDPAGPLYGATYRTVSNASISGTTLNITFAEKQRDTDPDNKLMAGMPYIIKWNSGDDIVNPVFTGVKIIHVGGGYMGASVRFSGNNDTMTDVKTQALPGFDKLLLGDDNKLHYVGDGASLGAFRAYFAVDPTKVGTANAPARLTSFNIDFGDGETTSLIENGKLIIENEAGAWYSLDGRKLSGKPTKSGIYVNNGGKVVIK